jgi:hypothetical protein
MLWFPLPVRVYLKPVVSKNVYGFCCGSAHQMWLTVGCEGLEDENGVKEKGRQI